MRPALPAVAAAALLVFAGCGGIDTPPEIDPSPPDETTTRSPYPPGVSADGLDDVERLVSAHTTAVRESGATVTSESTATVLVDGDPRSFDFNVTAWAATEGTRVYADRTRARIGGNGTMRTERVELYATETTVHRRHVREGKVTTSAGPRTERSDLVAVHVARSPFLKRVLTAETFDVVDTERRGGRTVTTLRADNEEFTDAGRRVFYATLEVTADGRILSLSVRQNPDANTAAGRRVTKATWTASVDAERPAWVENASSQ